MKFYPYISDRFIILMRRTIIIMKDFIGHILLFISAVVYILLFRHGSSEGDIRTVIVLYWERYSFLNLWCYVWVISSKVRTDYICLAMVIFIIAVLS